MKITNITIENYKCFLETQSFECGKINLFTGINGRGKTTVLQTILLISQSLLKTNVWKYLILKGEYVNLGEFEDVKNSHPPRSRDIKIAFCFDNELTLELHCNRDISSPHHLEIVNSDDILDKFDDEDFRNGVEDLFKHVHYVGADRLGPQLFMEKVDLPEFIHVGRRGEYAFEILAQSVGSQLNIVPNKELYRGVEANSLIQQTSEWMSYILDGTHLEIKGRDWDSSVLTRLAAHRSDPKLYKTVNIGFGYSYALPLIVSGLIAKPGEILIVENPEAHLHPKAQSRIGEFYSRIAASGVQVFIETHSEHVLNRLRLSCVKPDIPIGANDVEVYFFDSDFSIEHINLQKDGRLNLWPADFFDQQERDLAEIFVLTHNTKRGLRPDE